MPLSFTRYLRRLVILFLFFTCHSALAASSILVWPVYQIIESDQNGSALWLENRGAEPVSLQVRVLAWKQANFTESYADQTGVVASPPFATVAPGQRQLIRLIRSQAIPSNTEHSYRIIIDEVPSPMSETQQNQTQAVVGLQLQMRYLLPLFIDGEGIWTHERPDVKRDLANATKPILHWSVTNVDGKAYLQVNNSGIVHARLSNVFWSATDNPTQSVKKIADGFLGYVLPGKAMRWPLPSGATSPGGQLNAQIADNSKPIVIVRGE